LKLLLEKVVLRVAVAEAGGRIVHAEHFGDVLVEALHFWRCRARLVYHLRLVINFLIDEILFGLLLLNTVLSQL
jgi:hypothetical protein